MFRLEIEVASGDIFRAAFHYEGISSMDRAGIRPIESYRSVESAVVLVTIRREHLHPSCVLHEIISDLFAVAVAPASELRIILNFVRYIF